MEALQRHYFQDHQEEVVRLIKIRVNQEMELGEAFPRKEALEEKVHGGNWAVSLSYLGSIQMILITRVTETITLQMTLLFTYQPKMAGNRMDQMSTEKMDMGQR